MSVAKQDPTGKMFRTLKCFTNLTLPLALFAARLETVWIRSSIALRYVTFVLARLNNYRVRIKSFCSIPSCRETLRTISAGNQAAFIQSQTTVSATKKNYTNDRHVVKLSNHAGNQHFRTSNGRAQTLS